MSTGLLVLAGVRMAEREWAANSSSLARMLSEPGGAAGGSVLGDPNASSIRRPSTETGVLCAQC